GSVLSWIIHHCGHDEEGFKNAIMHLTQILTQRRQGAKKSIGFELLTSPLAGEGPGVRGCRQSLGQVHNPVSKRSKRVESEGNFWGKQSQLGFGFSASSE